MLLGIFHSVVVLEVALVFLEQVHKLEVLKEGLPPQRRMYRHTNTVVKKERPDFPVPGLK